MTNLYRLMSGKICRKEVKLALSSRTTKRLDIAITQTVKLEVALNVARAEQNDIDY